MITNIFVEGSSQWIFVRNLSRVSDVLHYPGSQILRHPVNRIRDTIAMIDDVIHSYISVSKFEMVYLSSSTSTGHTASVNTNFDVLKS